MGLGLGLMVFGAPFGLYSYYVLGNVTLAAMGMACVILGSVYLLTPASPVPLDVVRSMVEGANVNIEALLEEFGAVNRGVYLPPRDGRVYCFVPVVDGFDVGRLDSRPLRLVSGDGLTVFPPGAEVVRLAGIGDEMGLEDALGYVLVDYLEAAEGVKVVESGGNVVVQVVGPVVDSSFVRVRGCLGSTVASVAGCVFASLRGVPVRFLGEESVDGLVTLRFRLERVGQE